MTTSSSLSGGVDALPAASPESPSACSDDAVSASVAAWRSLLRAYSAISRRLEAELDATSVAGLGDLDVLLQLHLAPGERLRMSELAARVLITPSGLTRRVDRLEEAGLVERVWCASDRRGSWASLTPLGGHVLAGAAPRHDAVLDTLIAGRLDTETIAALTRTLAVLADADPRSPGPSAPGGFPEGG